jgi:hypothetical protein
MVSRTPDFEECYQVMDDALRGIFPNKIPPPREVEMLPVCECGDWRFQHVRENLLGRCGVCSQSRAPWDGCQQYKFSHMERHLVASSTDGQ